MNSTIEVEMKPLRAFVKAKEISIVSSENNQQWACIPFLGEFLVFPTYLDISSPQFCDLRKTLDEITTNFVNYQLMQVDRVQVTLEVAQSISELL